MNKILWLVVLLIIIVGGYWWWTSQSAMPVPSGQMGINGSADQGNTGGANTGTPQQPAGDGTSVSQNLALGTNSNATLGTYLIAYNGMTVYTKSSDSAGKSTCTGTCAQNWPPYTVPAGTILNLQAGVSGAIATIVRADGTTQVTYKGMPLYYYVGDKAAGDTTGQAMGGVWYVAKP